MEKYFTKERAPGAVPVTPLTAEALADWRTNQTSSLSDWLERTGFEADYGACVIVPENGGPGRVLLGLGKSSEAIETDPWPYAQLAQSLKAGDYYLENPLSPAAARAAALGWVIGHYTFSRYHSSAEGDAKTSHARLAAPPECDMDYVAAAAEATYLVRDLVNTPASDMGPDQLADAALTLAERFKASCRIIKGETLMTDFPMIHAVGRASRHGPCLIDITWGPRDAPKVTLVGKGVCFDSGGLNLKNAAGMALMKKDMGGGAHALGLAHLIMAQALPVRLRVLIPAVENSVSGNAMRPGDVLTSRKGLSVEIGNTDAEGRLVLADALALADEERPELILDFATLTGAARVALGPDLPALFTDDDSLAEQLLIHGAREADPLWRLPLWQPYAAGLKSKIADLNNISDGPFAGAITAGLFLKRFVTETPAWAHIDLYAWNTGKRPGRYTGGEAMAIRAIYNFLAQRYVA